MAGESDKFEIYKDKAGEYRWKRYAPNGQQVGSSTEGYKKKIDCEKNMNRGPNPKDKWEFYADRKGEHRWRRVASNGQNVGAASEGYANKSDAVKNAQRFGYTGTGDD